MALGTRLRYGLFLHTIVHAVRCRNTTNDIEREFIIVWILRTQHREFNSLEPDNIHEEVDWKDCNIGHTLSMNLCCQNFPCVKNLYPFGCYPYERVGRVKDEIHYRLVVPDSIFLLMYRLLSGKTSLVPSLDLGPSLVLFLLLSLGVGFCHVVSLRATSCRPCCWFTSQMQLISWVCNKTVSSF